MFNLSSEENYAFDKAKNVDDAGHQRPAVNAGLTQSKVNFA